MLGMMTEEDSEPSMRRVHSAAVALKAMANRRSLTSASTFRHHTLKQVPMLVSLPSGGIGAFSFVLILFLLMFFIRLFGVITETGDVRGTSISIAYLLHSKLFQDEWCSGDTSVSDADRTIVKFDSTNDYLVKVASNQNPRWPRVSNPYIGVSLNYELCWLLAHRHGAEFHVRPWELWVRAPGKFVKAGRRTRVPLNMSIYCEVESGDAEPQKLKLLFDGSVRLAGRRLALIRPAPCSNYLFVLRGIGNVFEELWTPDSKYGDGCFETSEKRYVRRKHSWERKPMKSVINTCKRRTCRIPKPPVTSKKELPITMLSEQYDCRSYASRLVVRVCLAIFHFFLMIAMFCQYVYHSLNQTKGLGMLSTVCFSSHVFWASLPLDIFPWVQTRYAVFQLFLTRGSDDWLFLNLEGGIAMDVFRIYGLVKRSPASLQMSHANSTQARLRKLRDTALKFLADFPTLVAIIEVVPLFCVFVAYLHQFCKLRAFTVTEGSNKYLVRPAETWVPKPEVLTFCFGWFNVNRDSIHLTQYVASWIYFVWFLLRFLNTYSLAYEIPYSVVRVHCVASGFILLARCTLWASVEMVDVSQDFYTRNGPWSDQDVRLFHGTIPGSRGLYISIFLLRSLICSMVCVCFSSPHLLPKRFPSGLAASTNLASRQAVWHTERTLFDQSSVSPQGEVRLTLDTVRVMAHLAAVAYEETVSDAKLSSPCCDDESDLNVSGLRLLDVVSDAGKEVFGFIAAWRYMNETGETVEDIVVTFRGTATVKNIMADLKTARKDWTNGVRVHAGFEECMAAMREPITKMVQSQLEDSSTRSLWLVGHSLGGAIATLMAVHLHGILSERNRVSINLCTFGSPRVGNSGFVKLFNRATSSSIRVVAEGDLVPTVPPLWLFFSHVSGCVRINPNGHMMVKPAALEKVLNQFMLLFPVFLLGLKVFTRSQKMNNHSMVDSYIPSLRSVLNLELTTLLLRDHRDAGTRISVRTSFASTVTGSRFRSFDRTFELEMADLGEPDANGSPRPAFHW